MKEDKKLMDFDDTETAEDLHKAFTSEFGELTDDEIDKLFEKTFGKSNKN